MIHKQMHAFQKVKLLGYLPIKISFSPEHVALDSARAIATKEEQANCILNNR